MPGRKREAGGRGSAPRPRLTSGKEEAGSAGPGPYPRVRHPGPGQASGGLLEPGFRQLRERAEERGFRAGPTQARRRPTLGRTGAALKRRGTHRPAATPRPPTLSGQLAVHCVVRTSRRFPGLEACPRRRRLHTLKYRAFPLAASGGGGGAGGRPRFPVTAAGRPGAVVLVLAACWEL